jgi:hypothetical protein
MKSARLLTIALFVAAAPTWAKGPSLDHKIDVPSQFRSGKSDAEGSFGWDVSDIARYIEGYERMWWSCVEIRAKDIDGECHWFCSGNLPATSGCSDGAQAVNKRINSNIRKFGKKSVQRQLRESIGMAE